MFSFEWNESKNLINLEKHLIDFEDAIAIFLGPTLEVEDDRRDYGEVRMIALGETMGYVLAVVFTIRDDVYRIISARKANRNERNAYYAALSG
jgi:hypothetical protein